VGGVTRRRWARDAGAGLLLCGAAAIAPRAARPAPAVGRPAPEFEATTFDGQKVRLADLRGDVVILNFWATWCGPCKVELPLLDAYYRARSSVGLRVLAVATEDSVPASYLRPLSKALAFPLVRRINGPYKVMTGLPTNYIIDRSGVLRYARAGAFDLDTMNDILTPLLNEAPPADEPAVSPIAARSP